MRRVLDRYDADLTAHDGQWTSTWQEPNLKNFSIEYLLFHEIGHHVAWDERHWSKANNRVLEEAADQYAFSRTTKRAITYKADTDPPRVQPVMTIQPLTQKSERAPGQAQDDSDVPRK